MLTALSLPRRSLMRMPANFDHFPAAHAPPFTKLPTGVCRQKRFRHALAAQPALAAFTWARPAPPHLYTP
jgi:hypothetical protein